MRLADKIINLDDVSGGDLEVIDRTTWLDVTK